MIKLLLQLVLPKILGITPFAAFAVASFVFGVADNERRSRKVQRAQEEQTETEVAIRGEQAGRERRSQVRKANTLRAQAEAIQFAQSEQVGGSGVSDDISGNLNRNFGDINFAQATGSSISSARTNVANSGRQSTVGIVNQQLQPLLFSNIDKLDTFFESAFTS